MEKKLKILVVINIVLMILSVVSITTTCVLLFAFNNNDLSAEEIFDIAKNSVVELKAEKENVSTSYGSAIFVSEDGLLVSNAHIVTYTLDGTTNTFDTLSIRFYGEEEYYPVSLKTYDTTIDLCLLKLETSVAFEYEPIVIEDSQNIKEGQTVYAVGNGSNHGISITQGIVSIPLINIAVDEVITPVIQCDLTIVSGNSGGALLNSEAKLIGITTFRLRDTNGDIVYGVAYSLPSNTVTSFLESYNY